VTKVRRTSGAAVLPLVAAAVGIGVGATPADAAICSPLSSASITGPSGTPTAGSTVHASARVSGMLLTAHMQIIGPGLNQQVGPSAISGTIEGAVRVPEPGVYTLKVMGNGTGCVYDSDAFSVKARPSASTPTPRGAGAPSAPGASRAPRLPKGIHDGATKGLKTPSSRMPFRLPPVAPDGTGPSVRYPSADPQVAAPPIKQSQPQATNAAHTVPPIKWGQSIALALVLLLLSAHMGMWSRRQRLAEAGLRRRGARRANTDQQITARMPLAGDHTAALREADRPPKPDGDTPPPFAAGYTGTRQRGGHGQDMFSADPSGAAYSAGHPDTTGRESWADPRSRTGTAGPSLSQNGWADPPSQATGQSPPIGSAGGTSAVDWESWVAARRDVSPADRANPRGGTDAAAQDARAGSVNRGMASRDARVYPRGETAPPPRPYTLDPPARPGRVGDGDLMRGDRADATGWAATPPMGAVGGRDSGADVGRVGSSGRSGSAVSLDRATRSGRGGYRGRRRRS
jgi:hypothetical protein